MTRQLARTTAPEVLGRARDLVAPVLRLAIDGIADDRMRLVAGYQMGFNDANGNPSESGGKAIRPALALLSAQAVLGEPDSGIPGAVAIELVHNFSLLHDDVMDRDLERRHRPTGWVAFGEGLAILAGNALLTRAIEVLMETGLAGRRSLPAVLEATQLLIGGQSQDLALEGRCDVTLDEVLAMEAGKTAALLSCASSVGALAAGAPEHVVAGLASFGHELGIAFQLVDDVLGVVGDPARTGKSSSSDVRAGKCSAPIVAALADPSRTGEQLAQLFADGPPATEADVTLATELIVEAGGVAWATQEADARLDKAIRQLENLKLVESAAADLAAVATYIVTRDR